MTLPPRQYSASLTTFGQMLLGAGRYTIPIFQRRYCWTANHGRQLVSDLIAALEIERDSEVPNRGYYVGTLVVYQEASAEGAPSRSGSPDYEVVDGKQRLVTLSILFAAIRDNLGEAAPAYVKAMLWRPDEAAPPLTLSPDEEAYFAAQVRRPGATLDPMEPEGLGAGCEAMRACQLAIVEELNDRSPAELIQLAEFIRDKVVLVLVETPDVECAYQVFVVQGEQGVPQSVMDVLKAKLLGGFAQPEREAALDRWNRLETRLGKRFEGLPAVIRALFGLGRGSAMAEVLPMVEQVGGARAFFDLRLEPIAKAYDVIASASHSGAPESGRINRALGMLGWLSGADWMPPAVEFLLRFPDAPSDFAAFLEELARFAIGMQLLTINHGQRVARFRRLIGALRKADSFALDQLPISLVEDEKARLLINANGKMHQRKSANCKLLLKYLSALAYGDDVSLGMSEVSVEHVLPLRGTSGYWNRNFPNAEGRALCAGMFGNMALIPESQNRAAKAQSYDAKRKLIFPDGRASPHGFTNELLSVPAWNPEIVREREARIQAQIKSVWRIGAK